MPVEERRRAVRSALVAARVGTVVAGAALAAGCGAVILLLLLAPAMWLWPAALPLVVIGATGIRRGRRGVAELRRRSLEVGTDVEQHRSSEELRRERTARRVARTTDRILFWSSVALAALITLIVVLITGSRALPAWWVLVIAVAFSALSIASELWTRRRLLG